MIRTSARPDQEAGTAQPDAPSVPPWADEALSIVARVAALERHLYQRHVDAAFAAGVEYGHRDARHFPNVARQVGFAEGFARGWAAGVEDRRRGGAEPAG